VNRIHKSWLINTAQGESGLNQAAWKDDELGKRNSMGSDLLGDCIVESNTIPAMLRAEPKQFKGQLFSDGMRDSRS